MSWEEQYPITQEQGDSAISWAVDQAGGDTRALVDVLETLGLRERLGYDFH